MRIEIVKCTKTSNNETMFREIAGSSTQEGLDSIPINQSIYLSDSIFKHHITHPSCPRPCVTVPYSCILAKCIETCLFLWYACVIQGFYHYNNKKNLEVGGSLYVPFESDNDLPTSSRILISFVSTTDHSVLAISCLPCFFRHQFLRRRHEALL